MNLASLRDWEQQRRAPRGPALTLLRIIDREPDAARRGPLQAEAPHKVERGSRREALLELIRQNNGLSRGEILERMGLKGDKAGESVSLECPHGLSKRNQVYWQDDKCWAQRPTSGRLSRLSRKED